MTNYERIKNMSVEGAWIKVKSRTKQLDITKKVKVRPDRALCKAV